MSEELKEVKVLKPDKPMTPPSDFTTFGQKMNSMKLFLIFGTFVLCMAIGVWQKAPWVMGVAEQGARESFVALFIYIGYRMSPGGPK